MVVYGVVAGAAAIAAVGQVWLARWARVLAPGEAFHPAYATWGNDVWPIHLVVLAWCAASAATLGAALAGRRRWAPVAAAVGALTPSLVAVGWMTAHARTAATAALVLGAVIRGCRSRCWAPRRPLRRLGMFAEVVASDAAGCRAFREGAISTPPAPDGSHRDQGVPQVALTTWGTP